MELIKKTFELLVALTKFGYVYLTDGTWLDDLKKIEFPLKKPQESQSKNGTSEYISLESRDEWDEATESEMRSKVMTSIYLSEEETLGEASTYRWPPTYEDFKD
tara:strand:+ start:58 stop:369 length:312 start_codon:yes stop_codon:yes gene_type:complete